MAAMLSGPMQVIFATVLPPLGVFCAVGLRSQFWLNLVFTLLGYVPGVVHAFHVLLTLRPRTGSIVSVRAFARQPALHRPEAAHA